MSKTRNYAVAFKCPNCGNGRLFSVVYRPVYTELELNKYQVGSGPMVYEAYALENGETTVDYDDDGIGFRYVCGMCNAFWNSVDELVSCGAVVDNQDKQTHTI